MKTCIIGDSHLAMLVNAHKAYPVDGMDVTPVPLPRPLEGRQLLVGTEMRSDDDDLTAFWERGGLGPVVDLTVFDRVVFVSYTATIFNALALLRDHAVTGWTDAKPVMKSLNSSLGNPTSRRLLTPAVYRASLAGTIQANHTHAFVDELRRNCDVPITIIPPPFLAYNTLQIRKSFAGLRRILQQDDGAKLASALNDAHDMAFAAMSDVSVLHQPPETVIHGCLTAKKYTEGATRYGVEMDQEANDIIHAGPAMGGLLLNEIKALGPCIP